jgi:tRNA pseudouridine55 synthase
VHGVLMLDKPPGITSNRALQVAKRLLEAEKAGHTGTLDPLATGLLPLCFGEATKFSQTLLDADKAYQATLKLGVRTDTCDAEGAVIATAAPELTRAITEADLRAVLVQFSGAITQTPPMFSALKVEGKPLYAYAREGVTLDRAARQVMIHDIELQAFEGESVRITVSCSKGTYIRTLADDIGQALGCGAHLIALRRTRIGDFSLEGAVTLDQLEGIDAPSMREARLKPADALLAGLPMLRLDEEQASRIVHGQRVARPELVAGAYRLYGSSGFVGLARVADGVIHPQRLIRTL